MTWLHGNTFHMVHNIKTIRQPRNYLWTNEPPQDYKLRCVSDEYRILHKVPCPQTHASVNQPENLLEIPWLYRT